jgi:VWFA-related protein
VAKAIVSSNRPEDRAFILRLIDGQALLAADWASDKTALLNSLNAMKSANGMMSLIDSVYAGSEEFTRQSPAEDIADRRRAIILITDGIDRGSSKKMDELLSRLHKENIQVFAVGFDSPRNTRWRAAELLETLAEKTGGRSLYLETREELEASAGLISSYLRSQYVIGYSRSRDAKNDSPRKVRVKIIDKPDRDKYSITSRLHYFLPSN